MAANRIQVRPTGPGDRSWVEQATAVVFGSKLVAARGRLLEPASHRGFVALVAGDPVGFVTYLVERQHFEVTAIATLKRGMGAGTALMAAAVEEALRLGCRRVWLITTNDNLNALRFYQKRGFEIVCVYRGAVDISRAMLKPEIPPTGDHGIPLRDEIEMELRLTQA
jgi:ribosomal protein S18 acetylase RimI-like enzyme